MAGVKADIRKYETELLLPLVASPKCDTPEGILSPSSLFFERKLQYCLENSEDLYHLMKGRLKTKHVSRMINLETCEYYHTRSRLTSGYIEGKRIMLPQTEITMRYVDEAFNGLCLINHLGKYIPNFIHTYGIYFPDKTKKEGLEEICIFTKFVDGVKFDEFITLESTTMSDVICVLMQVFFALYSAHLKCKLTHFNLLCSNIIISDLGTEKQIRYNDPFGEYCYVKTRYLASILKYDRIESVKICDIPVTKIKKRDYNVCQSYPFYDIQTLLFDLYQPLRKRGMKLELCSEIYSHIGDVDEICSILDKYEIVPPVKWNHILMSKGYEYILYILKKSKYSYNILSKTEHWGIDFVV